MLINGAQASSLFKSHIAFIKKKYSFRLCGTCALFTLIRVSQEAHDISVKVVHQEGVESNCNKAVNNTPPRIKKDLFYIHGIQQYLQTV